MSDTGELIDDACVPTIFYDGLANCEVRAGVMRMIAFVRRVNQTTGRVERLPVAVLVRPAENTFEIRASITCAMRGSNLIELAQ